MINTFALYKSEGQSDSLSEYLPPLQSFPNESSIQQKVLGLLVSLPFSSHPVGDSECVSDVQS